MILLDASAPRTQVVAVYKDDGERGHHMQDYIPKEELAKFMAKTGDTKLAQEVRGLVVWLYHTSAAACTVQCCSLCTAPPKMAKPGGCADKMGHSCCRNDNVCCVRSALHLVLLLALCCVLYHHHDRLRQRAGLVQTTWATSCYRRWGGRRARA